MKKKQFVAPQVSFMKMQPEVSIMAGSAPVVNANPVSLQSMGTWE